MCVRLCVLLLFTPLSASPHGGSPSLLTGSRDSTVCEVSQAQQVPSESGRSGPVRLRTGVQSLWPAESPLVHPSSGQLSCATGKFPKITTLLMARRPLPQSSGGSRWSRCLALPPGSDGREPEQGPAAAPGHLSEREAGSSLNTALWLHTNYTTTYFLSSKAVRTATHLLSYLRRACLHDDMVDGIRVWNSLACILMEVSAVKLKK